MSSSLCDSNIFIHVCDSGLCSNSNQLQPLTQSNGSRQCCSDSLTGSLPAVMHGSLFLVSFTGYATSYLFLLFPLWLFPHWLCLLCFLDSLWLCNQILLLFSNWFSLSQPVLWFSLCFSVSLFLCSLVSSIFLYFSLVSFYISFSGFFVWSALILVISCGFSVCVKQSTAVTASVTVWATVVVWMNDMWWGGMWYTELSASSS